MSHEVRLPFPCIFSAIAKLLPPGAAQQSRTAVPGFGSATNAASALAASCTVMRPARNASVAAASPPVHSRMSANARCGVTVIPARSSSAFASSGAVFILLTRTETGVSALSA